MKKVYLSGPMTGVKEYNYPAFNDATARLRAAGYEVINPAEFPKQKSWAKYMEYALDKLPECDTIVTLPGWERSRGAVQEVRKAESLNMVMWQSKHIPLLSNIKSGERK